MVSVGIKEEFEQYVHNADLGPNISDKCNQHHTLTEPFVKGFKFHPRESRVLITHKYRRSQQFSRVSIQPKFIASTQGGPKNICKY